MEKFYSKIKNQEDKLLHMVVRDEDFVDGRTDIVDPNEFIQCSLLKLNSEKTFKPHKHKHRDRNWSVIAQESWVVIRGSVKCFFYDEDDQLIATPILYSGDASFTLYGGHNYLILEDNSKIMEYKTGKYEGQSIDKEFI